MSQIEFFDVHTHVQFAAFDKDREEVIKRSLENKVGFLNVGTQKETSLAAVHLAQIYENWPLYAAVGLHPLHAHKSFFDKNELSEDKDSISFFGEEFDFDFYKDLVLSNQKKVLAIGECGLDYFRVKEKEYRERQQEVFQKQIGLAYQVKKPLMIHCRLAFDDLLLILKNYKNYLNDPPGIVHFFSGNKQQAQDFLNLGFSFTFSGVITFSRDYDDLIKFLPLKNILSETDAPYVAPVPFRGRRNEPLYVIEVVKKIAELKGLTLEQTKSFLLENVKKFFKIELEAHFEKD